MVPVVFIFLEILFCCVVSVNHSFKICWQSLTIIHTNILIFASVYNMKICRILSCKDNNSSKEPSQNVGTIEKQDLDTSFTFLPLPDVSRFYNGFKISDLHITPIVIAAMYDQDTRRTTQVFFVWVK